MEFKDIILISRISKETPYSAEYLSLLVRTKKISGRKVGRNWYISRKSLIKYLEKRSNIPQVSLNLETKFPSGARVVLAQEITEPKGPTLKTQEFTRSDLKNEKPGESLKTYNYDYGPTTAPFDKTENSKSEIPNDKQIPNDKLQIPQLRPDNNRDSAGQANKS